jgi:hypothetical protein
METNSGKPFLKILSDPPRIQETLWTRTFQEIQNKLPASSVLPKCIFLTLHASYYHQRKREFLSPVDFTKLVELKNRVKMVVVLIDDCYDIYKRLMGEGEMFGYVRKLCEKEPQRALLESITNLHTILQWREIEIAFSRKISQLLDVPLYIIAVKHPICVLSRLIQAYEEKNILYLSHPISSILKGTHPRPPAFYYELNKFIEQILAIDNLVLFIPDTIDEKRIKKQEETGQYLPQLLSGWPLPFPENEWLFTPLPSAVKRLNPLNPANFNIHQAESGFQATVSVLLEVLLEIISHQINSRDLSLVEQGRGGVALYRPYWAASVPPGVEAELKYNADLANQYGEKDRRVIAVNASEDLGKLRIKNLFTEIIMSVDDIFRDSLNNLCEDWLNDPDTVSLFENIDAIQSGKEAIRTRIEHGISGDYQFVGSAVTAGSSTLKVGEMLAKEDDLDKGWAVIFENAPAEDQFQKKYVVSGRDVYIMVPEVQLKQYLADNLNKIFE